MNGLSPAWVICPHRSLLVHLPTLSCHNSSRCSRARRPMAKVSLELMRVQVCRCQLKIQGATKSPTPSGGAEPEATPPEDFLKSLRGQSVELHHWAVSMCDHHSTLTHSTVLHFTTQ